jgi:uroporphyrin-III C-methyltransferase / precorrin-2 dehydrogenase / sirohydrochlorin ferrochelatase
MRFLPLFLDVSAGTVALIGAGPAALNKLRLLRAAGADVRWYSDEVDVAEELLLASAPPGRLELSLSDPLQANFREFRMVVSATGTPLDDAVAALARAGNVPVNVVDRPELSSFIFPAIIDRGEVVVAIGTGGASPVLARRLREHIEAILPARIGELATLLRRYRGRLADARHGAHAVRRFWEQAVDGRVGAAVVAGRGREAEAALIRDIANIGKANSGGANLGKETRPTGMVHLVGAGPGDPDLLTLRALHALQGADIVFYDELVTPGILDRARRDAERVFVGKRRGVPGLGQDEINRRLRDAARNGRSVVRLKGGDPFVFGRGGEELDYLRRSDVPVIVVPGITAALGCAAEAGLPLTLRNEATRLSLVTAQRADQALATDWSGLGDPHTTVVVYMGLAAASAVRDGLIAAGRDPRTPVAVLARGTRADGATVTGHLEALEALGAEVGEGPALIVVGEVVAHSDPWLAALAAPIPQEIAA